MRIQIHHFWSMRIRMRIQIQTQIRTQIQGFDHQKLKKITAKKKFFVQKLEFTYI